MKSMCGLILVCSLMAVIIVGMATNPNLKQDIILTNMCGSKLIEFAKEVCKNFNLELENVDFEMSEFVLRKCCLTNCSVKQIIINYCLEPRRHLVY